MEIHLSNSINNAQSSANRKGVNRNAVLQFCMAVFFLLFSTGTLFANNLKISNSTLSGKDVTNHFVMVNFDVSWENSWRVSTGPSNWDAAWIFIKYRVTTQSDWHHATLHYIDGSGTGDGHTVPANGVIESSNDNGAGGAYGVFIYRNADMPQTGVNYTGVQLRWDYGFDGVFDGDDVEICVLGIEMVYVPQSSFYVGTGNDAIDWSVIYTYPTANTPYQITSENAITVSPTANSFYYQVDLVGGANYSGDQSGPIPSEFPKGYKAFYCMKYEITQGQYVAFLNKLPQGGVDNRVDVSHFDDQRFRIFGTFPGTYTTDAPYIACNWLNWADVAAYLDWSALRPMTELEFEKACKGPSLPAQQGMYAWGTTNILCAWRTLNNPGQADESATFGSNCACNNGSSGSFLLGPLRVGNFAKPGNNREQSGATYYGIMEMSGNVWEYTITFGWSAGRAFLGNHGDGELGGPFYEANTFQWPQPNAIGVGYRGGGWNTTANPHHRVDNRRNAAQISSSRDGSLGGRGVRTAN